MVSAETFRLPEELEYRHKIRDHPGFRRLAEIVPAFELRAPPERRHRHRRCVGTRVSRRSAPVLWDAVGDALRLFGLRADYEVITVDGYGSVAEHVLSIAGGQALMLKVPRKALSGARPDELRAIIGHCLGHHLLDHGSDSEVGAVLELAQAAQPVTKGVATDDLWREPVLLDLFRYAMVLLQLQELSADRLGLLLSRNFEATAIAAVRLISDHVGDRYDVAQTLAHAETVTDEADWVMRIHPYEPNRCLALKLFYESDLYRQAVGLAGGTPIGEFGRILPTLVPLFDRADFPRHFDTRSDADRLDDYLLELVLMDSFAVADARRIRVGERLIDRYIPNDYQSLLLERFDELTDDFDDDAHVLDPWLRRAAQKDSTWKIKMIGRYLSFLGAEMRITGEGLTEVAGLASAMGAAKECQELFQVAFGYDPYAWPLAKEPA